MRSLHCGRVGRTTGVGGKVNYFLPFSRKSPGAVSSATDEVQTVFTDFRQTVCGGELPTTSIARLWRGMILRPLNLQIERVAYNGKALRGQRTGETFRVQLLSMIVPDDFTQRLAN